MTGLLATLYADAVLTSATSRAVAALLEEVMPLREKLLTTAEAHVLFGDFDERRVAEIRTGTGYADAATDLIALGSLFREAWDRIAHRTLVSREDVDRAAVLGTQLVRAIVADSASVDIASERRVKSYTLLLSAYEECRRAVTYLRWHEGDVEMVLPTVYKKTRRATEPNADPVEAVPTPPAPSPTQPMLPVPQPEEPEQAHDAQDVAPHPVPT